MNPEYRLWRFSRFCHQENANPYLGTPDSVIANDIGVVLAKLKAVRQDLEVARGGEHMKDWLNGINAALAVLAI